VRCKRLSVVRSPAPREEPCVETLLGAKVFRSSSFRLLHSNRGFDEKRAFSTHFSSPFVSSHPVCPRCMLCRASCRLLLSFSHAVVDRRSLIRRTMAANRQSSSPRTFLRGTRAASSQRCVLDPCFPSFLLLIRLARACFAHQIADDRTQGASDPARQPRAVSPAYLLGRCCRRCRCLAGSLLFVPRVCSFSLNANPLARAAVASQTA
jgi:hypothetical protein